MTTHDADDLLRTNMTHVFSERDSAKRKQVIADIYTDTPVFFEPDAVMQGRGAISDAVDALLERFGPDFVFRPIGTANSHHGLACLAWQAGPANGPAAVTGMDVAEITDGRIARLWVMLNPPA